MMKIGDSTALLARYPVREAAVGLSKVSYRMAGEGPPIVLLHGIGSQSGSWIHQLGGLSDHYKVIAWDAPGYGLSDPLSPMAPTAADYADILGGLLKTLQVQRCLLVGQSLGAMIAASFAAHSADDLCGLALLGPANGYGRAEPSMRDERLAERLHAMQTLGPERFAEARASRLVSASASADALQLVRLNMGQLSVSGYAQAARLLAYGWLIDDAARYAGPTLVACGSDDQITPEADCRAVAKAFVNGEFRLLPGLGHASYIENPLVVNDMLARFAERCRGSRP